MFVAYSHRPKESDCDKNWMSVEIATWNVKKTFVKWKLENRTRKESKWYNGNLWNELKGANKLAAVEIVRILHSGGNTYGRGLSLIMERKAPKAVQKTQGCCRSSTRSSCRAKTKNALIQILHEKIKKWCRESLAKINESCCEIGLLYDLRLK